MTEQLTEQALLDASCANLMHLDDAGRILHVNRQLADRLPTACVLCPGIDWEEWTGALGARLAGPAELRFTGLLIEDAVGVQLKALPGTAGYVATVSFIGPQQQLKAGLRDLQADVAQGGLSGSIDVRPGAGLAATVAQGVDMIVTTMRRNLAPVQQVLDAMAECDLRVATETGLGGEVGQLQKMLGVTIANLTESIRQTSQSATAIASTAKQIAERNKNLSKRTQDQSDNVRANSATMEELSSAVANAADGARRANEQGRETRSLTEEGREAVRQVVAAMESINRRSDEIGDIVGIINDIAFQTNILALNAAVEAARAGEHGRGFAIVATEVRSLSGRTTEAANQIRDLIRASGEVSAEGRMLALRADEQMESILRGVESTGEQIAAISQAADEQTVGIKDANQALSDIDRLAQENHALVDELARATDELDCQAGYLADAAGLFRLPEGELSHALHREALDVGRRSASAVGEAFERAVAQGRIGMEELFEHRYTPIAGTNPEKHNTPYDGLADELLPVIQEDVLQGNPVFVYAIAADFNGYVPTHNNRFSQPLTGDYEQDLAGNRTKRIFSDRVGQQVGRNTEPYKLQTYRRDTGELMFDMSVPILVSGRHWGGFRLGYRIE